MLDQQSQIALAQLRLDIRQIDAELAQIKQEALHYRKLGFGNDLLEINARMLLEKRQEKIKQLQIFERRLNRRRAGARTGLLGWLLLPAMLCMMGWRSLVGR